MANINLAGNNIEEQSAKSSDMSFLMPLIISGVILLVVGGAYLGIFLYDKSLKNKIESIKVEYDSEIKKLNSEENLDIIDFQNRISLAKEMMIKENLSLKSLSELERTMIPENFITNFSYDGKIGMVQVGCMFANFHTAALQINSFKGSQFFKNTQIKAESGQNDSSAKTSALNLTFFVK